MWRVMFSSLVTTGRKVRYLRDKTQERQGKDTHRHLLHHIDPPVSLVPVLSPGAGRRAEECWVIILITTSSRTALARDPIQTDETDLGVSGSMGPWRSRSCLFPDELQLHSFKNVLKKSLSCTWKVKHQIMLSHILGLLINCSATQNQFRID